MYVPGRQADNVYHPLSRELQDVNVDSSGLTPECEPTIFPSRCPFMECDLRSFASLASFWCCPLNGSMAKAGMNERVALERSRFHIWPVHQPS